MVDPHLDKLFYHRPSSGISSEDRNTIEMRFKPGPSVDDFKRICATMAVFLGYHIDNVEECFGLTHITHPLEVKILEYDIVSKK